MSFSIVMNLEQYGEIFGCGPRGDGLPFRRSIK